MKRKSRLNRVTAFDVILAIILIGFCATIILPFIHIIAVSFSHKNYVISGSVSFWPKGFSFNNYIELLSDGRFFNAYKNTIFITVVGTILSLSTTAMAAYALSRRRMVGHGIYSGMITVTMFFGGGMIPTYMLITSLGLQDNLWALILPGMISTWNLIIMRSFFVAYPQEIVESGYLDGLTDAGVFFRLVLPTSKAALATIGLYYAVGYWNSYMSARLYIRSPELMTAQQLLQDMVQNYAVDNIINGENENTHLVTSSVRNCAIMIVITPIMCVYPFIQKYFVKGVMVGSIKG